MHEPSALYQQHQPYTSSISPIPTASALYQQHQPCTSSISPIPTASALYQQHQPYTSSISPIPAAPALYQQHQPYTSSTSPVPAASVLYQQRQPQPNHACQPQLPTKPYKIPAIPTATFQAMPTNLMPTLVRTKYQQYRLSTNYHSTPSPSQWRPNRAIT